MSRKTVQVLAGIIVALVLLLVVVDRDTGYDTVEERQVLLPGFKDLANEATRITINGATGEEGVTIRQADGYWVVSTGDEYPADVNKLGQLVQALATARVVEEKTSNPENYSKLGVDDPDDGGEGHLVTIGGPDFSYAVILGNAAQQDFRYARIPEQATSYLIDQNPSLPDSPAGWLLQDIIDINPDRIRRVSIAHDDGETIVIEKTAAEQTDFVVLDMPEGRELSYPTVANGMAGALADLQLSDVRKPVGAPATTSVTFETWEGLALTVDIMSEDETSWLAFAAATADDESDTASEASEINERLAGWEYRVPEHKQNLLLRRWDDILKAADAD